MSKFTFIANKNTGGPVPAPISFKHIEDRVEVLPAPITGSKGKGSNGMDDENKQPEFVAILGNGGWYEFPAVDETDAISEVNARFADMSWRLYAIDPIDGQVGTDVIAQSGTDDNGLTEEERVAEAAQAF